MKLFNRLKLLCGMRKLNALVASAFVLLVTTSVAGCTARSTEPPIMTPVRDFWREATSLARQRWHTEAYVKEVSIDSPVGGDTLGSPCYPFVRYDFAAPGERAEIATVTCWVQLGGGCDLSIKERDVVAQCTPITLDDFSLDTGEVLEIGLREGGERYKQAGTVYLLIRLARSDPGRSGDLQWLVSFWDRESLEALILLIDPKTGEVLEVREQEVEPPPP